MDPRLIFALTCLAFALGITGAQETRISERRSSGILVRRNRDGDGIQILDQRSGRELWSSNSDDDSEDEIDQRIVAGLIDWLDKKKKKKDKDKEKPKPEPQPEPKPEPKPVEPAKPVKPEIHIHIHTTKKKDHKKTDHYGHSEHYHTGHYEHDKHDKHFHGKHSWPLLGHHMNWAKFAGHYGDLQGDDFHSGYESSQVAKVVKDQANRNPIAKDLSRLINPTPIHLSRPAGEKSGK